MLGVASGELVPGERLPSTRELARRFHLHPNTVSAAYRQLEREGKVELRRGSGVFVKAHELRNGHNSSSADETVADRVIAEFFERAREHGVGGPVLRRRLERWLAAAPPDQFLLVEPDEELRRIVVAEVEEAVRLPVRGCGLEVLRSDASISAGAVALALPSKATIVREILDAGAEMVALRVRSVPGSLKEWLPVPTGMLVGVASRWPEFLTNARTMLVAAGIDGDSLLLRDAREKEWLRGMEQAEAVVCDVITAKELPLKTRAIPFRLLAESSIAELQRIAAAMKA
ncbi:MAG TPA: GntR family transcriptional regulator [Edaphobacter sp.]